MQENIISSIYNAYLDNEFEDIQPLQMTYRAGMKSLMILRKNTIFQQQNKMSFILMY